MLVLLCFFYICYVCFLSFIISFRPHMSFSLFQYAAFLPFSLFQYAVFLLFPLSISLLFNYYPLLFRCFSTILLSFSTILLSYFSLLLRTFPPLFSSPSSHPLFALFSFPRRSFAIRYARRSEEIPAAPREVAHHPSSVSLMLMKRLLDESAAANQSFGNHLVTKYSSIDRTKAAQIIGAPPLSIIFQLGTHMAHKRSLGIAIALICLLLQCAMSKCCDCCSCLRRSSSRHQTAQCAHMHIHA